MNIWIIWMNYFFQRSSSQIIQFLRTEIPDFFHVRKTVNFLILSRIRRCYIITSSLILYTRNFKLMRSQISGANSKGRQFMWKIFSHSLGRSIMNLRNENAKDHVLAKLELEAFSNVKGHLISRLGIVHTLLLYTSR